MGPGLNILAISEYMNFNYYFFLLFRESDKSWLTMLNILLKVVVILMLVIVFRGSGLIECLDTLPCIKIFTPRILNRLLTKPKVWKPWWNLWFEFWLRTCIGKEFKHLMKFMTQLYSRILSYMHWVYCTLIFLNIQLLSFKPSGLSRMW